MGASESLLDMTLETSAALREPGATWLAGGPRGMRVPVGVFIDNNPQLRSTTFREWMSIGEFHGIEILPFQQPLYYMIKLRKIKKIQRSGCRCQYKDCGSIALFRSLPCKHKCASDMCCQHALMHLKRGSIAECGLRGQYEYVRGDVQQSLLPLWFYFFAASACPPAA